MFNSQGAVAARVGRLAFGLVMLAGAGLLFFSTIKMVLGGGVLRVLEGHKVEPPIPMSTAVMCTWLAAVVAGFAAYHVAKWRPRLLRDPGPVVSFAVPAIGVALCAPITVHFLFVVLTGGTLGEFDRWAMFALPAMVFTHAAFAALVGMRAVRLARSEPPPSVTMIFGLTVLVSGFPFLFLSMVIVMLTAIPIVPLLVAMPGLKPDHDDPVLPSARVLA